MNKLKKLNEAGLAHILLIIILIIGIIAGVYLVQKTQIFKPKASADLVEWVQSTGASNNCVTSQNGNTVTTCGEVKFKIFAPADLENNTSNGSSDSSGSFQGE